MAALRGVAVGAGYFSQFHYEAWRRIAEVDLVAVCDADRARAEAAARRFGIGRWYTDFVAMFEAQRPDLVDVITPPATHEALCLEAGRRGIHVICQKPLAPTLDRARRLVEAMDRCGVRFMVHENFRFQPWYREIRRLVDQRVIGRSLHSLGFRARTGDGWGQQAYLERQPYFRTMPRLLVHETGVHFIDTFRYLGGEIRRVYAHLRRLNPAIAGEDCGLLVFEFECGAVGLWDGNRYNESAAADPRYTFGELLVEADGSIHVKPLGRPEQRHDFQPPRRGFAGDCCHATLRHFVERLLDGGPFETDAGAYLRNLEIEEALYRSASQRTPVDV